MLEHRSTVAEGLASLVDALTGIDPDELCATELQELSAAVSPAGQVHRLKSLTDSITALQRRALLARDRGCVARG